MEKVELTPALQMVFGQVQQSDEHIQFLMALVRSVQELPKKWRDNPVSVEQCIRDLDALVTVKEP